MRASVRKMGNSSGVIIPKPILNEIGVKAGDQIEMVIEGGKIVLAPIETNPRAGWAEASEALAASGGDKLIWPEFGNEGDENLVW